MDELKQAAADQAQCARSFPALEEGFHHMLKPAEADAQSLMAVINGDCLGGGYELAPARNFRLAADGPHQIGLPEALPGILPGGSGIQRLPRLIGRSRALQVMLVGTAYHPRVRSLGGGVRDARPHLLGRRPTFVGA